MGPLLAIFLVISLNMAPEGAQSVTLDNYVVEGVGIYPDATRFLITSSGDGSWLLHDAQGAPWFTVTVDGPLLMLTNIEGGTDQVDIGAAVGLPADEWWASELVEPPGVSPLVLTHLPNGVNVTLDGLRAAEVRW